MATTTNFGWETPDDTDLVKDGAAAMRTLGNSIDTSFVDLKGGTTGQVLSKTSGTDLDFTWVTTDDTNAIQNAIVDAKGDLIAATAADTPARLAVGTNGQVLTADSTAATGLAWATSSSGGMTLISTTTLSGSSTSVSVAANSYVKLFISISGINMSTAASFNCRFNSDSSSGNVVYLFQYNEIATSQGTFNFDSTALPMPYPNLASGANNSSAYIEIMNPNLSSRKNGIAGVTGLGTTTHLAQGIQFSYNGTAVISNLTFNTTAGTFSGGTVQLYGVK